MYGLKSISIPKKYEAKDISELIKKVGIEESKQILENLLK